MEANHLRYESSICISGLTASGKSTHSHLLAGEFGLIYVSGSQIQLNFLGVSPIQPKDFWITEDAKKLWDPDQFRQIDAELIKIEGRSSGCIFDTSTMPWRHLQPALCIWLESDLKSRVLKSIVSHRGRNHFNIDDYPSKIAEKDSATISLYRSLYDINIGTDLSCFDLILDIGGLIREPTLDASLASIQIAHKFVRAAVGYHLTGKPRYLDDFASAVQEHPGVVRLCNFLP